MTRQLTLISKHLSWEDVTILEFAPADGDSVSFVPGQYMTLFVYTADGETLLGGRMYTIASLPSEKVLRFAVRRRGAISSALCDLRIGMKVTADGPSGVFCLPKDHASPVICLAGGIGIVPFVTWARALHEEKQFQDGARILIAASNTTEHRAPFLDEVATLSEHDPPVSMRSHLTRQSASATHPSHLHRIQADDVREMLGENTNTALLAICGSISFTSDLRHVALSLGVPEEHILTEAFY